MGVTGLWKLIEPCGKPVPVETLEGKVLAVDISIWLHQVVKGFQDSKGSALNNAHLLGLFHRLCKLLYYRVRPVFIFDGCVPQLKRDTIARRQQQRNKLSNEADRIQALLLQSLAKEKVVQQALGTNAELLLKSPSKRGAAAKANKNDEDDLFKLPELPASSASQFNEPDSELDDQDYASTSATSDSSFDESTARHTYNASLQAIDVRSQHFKNLPADVRHEILTDIKETRKQSSWGRLHELPARSDDFCSFQMKRLLKRRAVQESLEEAVQEMGGHTLTYAELSEFFSEEGIVTPTAIEESTRQISSDEHTRFLLVRDLKKKALEDSQKAVKIKCETIKEEEVDQSADEQPSTSEKIVKSPVPSDEQQKNMGAEYDSDLAMALALSLEQSGKVYDEKDYDYESDQDLRLNREQSKQLRHAAKGPARTYMIEYGGMNDEEVENIMEATQLNDTQSLEKFLNTTNVNDKTSGDDITNNSIEEAKQLSLAIEESKKTLAQDLAKSKQIQAIDSDNDSDLEEVVDQKTTSTKKSLEIHVDIKYKLNEDDDLFADIFEIEAKLNISPEKKVTEACDKIEKVKDGHNMATLPKEMEEPNKSKEGKENTGTKYEAILITDSENKADSDGDDLCEVKETESELKVTTLNVKTTVPLDSILDDLKKQTEEVKNIKLNISNEEEKSPVAFNSILNELKRQTDEVKNIKLESIKLSSSTVIELSSDDEASKANAPTGSKDVIELCDSENENEKRRTSPNKTPSKSKAITDYFETSYKIIRTPDKPSEAQVTPPTTPKVPKPYFVKRTPKSGRKRAGDELSDGSEGISPNKKSSKAAKSLFEDKEPEKAETVNTEDLIQDAADALKSQKTAEELQTMASNLAQERRDLEVERNRQDRMGMSISQRMSNDCQELLRLFGIPYIVAPMEAEAQCAFLNAVELTNGTITDDSDIWLFGGRTVYKNFFAQNKHVLEFRAEQIEQTFNCNRGKLIQLACLVGSDYTTGIHGIGAVTALEILASFSTSNQLEASSSAGSMQSVLSTLVKFRDWWQAHKNSNLPIGSSARLSLRKKLKNIELHEGFPSTSVVEAYLTPKVDDNRDAFSWGSPDVESIREFARKSFGWTTSKTDDILMPVMKKINEKKIQGSIRNYFTAKSAVRVQQPQVSKRVQTAIDKMSGKIDLETPEKPKRAPRRVRNKTAVNTESQDDEAADNNPNPNPIPARPKRAKRKSAEATNVASPEKASTSNATSKPAKCARIPNTKEVIPQRERDLEQMRQNKAKAAEVLKASSKAASKKT
ncbi:DNA repair protein complementing XP-G cells homolog [Drosophila innubila]|uniref:DNA repair protein complementing XP-G cells homolog n=1 Tax=Drosophila innubila TaxID=198719 RepID=UPI00148D2DB0|nr:DNA repair protein complementing XP-G cells homolog [Drosophila innubila]